MFDLMPKILGVTWPRPHPFCGNLFMHLVGIPYAKLRDEFEGSSSNSFEDILDRLPENLGVTWPKPRPFWKKLFAKVQGHGGIRYDAVLVIRLWQYNNAIYKKCLSFKLLQQVSYVHYMQCTRQILHTTRIGTLKGARWRCRRNAQLYIRCYSLHYRGTRNLIACSTNFFHFFPRHKIHIFPHSSQFAICTLQTTCKCGMISDDAHTDRWLRCSADVASSGLQAYPSYADDLPVYRHVRLHVCA